MPGATVNNNASGTFIVTDVSGSTWNENVSGNTIVFNDPNPGTNLVIGAGQTVAGLTLNSSAIVTIPSDATVTTLTVEAGAQSTTINNAGLITNLTSKATGVVLTGEGTVMNPTTSGDGTLVDGDGAPVEGTEPALTPKEEQVKNGTRLVGVAVGIDNAINQDTLGYLTNRVTTLTSKGDAETQVAINHASLLHVFTAKAPVKTNIQAYDSKGKIVLPGALIVSDNLQTVVDGLVINLTIDGDDLVLGEGTSMTTELFDKIKAQVGTSDRGYYAITVTKLANTKEKLAKIHFFQDGTAKLVK